MFHNDNTFFVSSKQEIEQVTFMDKAAKIIRVLTVAPLMAGVMLTILFLWNPSLTGGWAGYLCGLLFLTLLPLLAYPAQPRLKAFRDRGRDGQRSLAMLFAVGGYVLGCLTTLFLHAPRSLWIIYLEYLISGLIILLFNKAFGLKASGHACGVAGPVALLVYFGVPALLAGLGLLVLVYASSLRIKRHTPGQLAGGTLIPLATLGLLALLFSVI